MEARLKSVVFRGLVCLIGMAAVGSRAAVVYYELDNVVQSDGHPLTGIFSWTYADPEEFENGTGEFIALDIPWTAHDQTDLNITIDSGSSIEFTLVGDFHDDGVDVQLFFEQALSATNGTLLNLTRSKYDIGGNGFHSGTFLSGRVTPIKTALRVGAATPGAIELSWAPYLPGHALQEKTNLSTNWVNSASGTNNPVVIPTTASRMFYRVAAP